jgi:hypothetical protein
MSEETYTIESLLVANSTLAEEVARLRNSNRVLRTVHKALRATLESQRAQLELAQFNDDVFKRFCSGEFDHPGQFDAVITEQVADGGLPEPTSQVDQSV